MGDLQVRQGGHSRTHTKKKRVQTWSETGQTQMLPCFCRSLEVITAGARGCWMWDGGQRACLGRAHWGDPPPLHPPGEPTGAACPPHYPPTSPHLRKARCSSGCGSGGSGTGWSGSVGRTAGVTTPSPAPMGAISPFPSFPSVPWPITWGIVFIRLYRCTSSSLDGIRCCPFPIPVEEARQGLSVSQGTLWGDLGTHATDRDCHTQCPHPAAGPWEPPKSVCSSF